MEKFPIWATQDRNFYIAFAIALFLILIYSCLAPTAPKSLIDTLEDITSIGIFSITFTFFYTEGIDMFLRQAFREEGRKEGKKEIAEKIKTLQEDGVDPKDTLEIIIKDVTGQELDQKSV